MDMRRQEFITLLGGAAVAWPLAKQPAVSVVGLRGSGSVTLLAYQPAKMPAMAHRLTPPGLKRRQWFRAARGERP